LLGQRPLKLGTRISLSEDPDVGLDARLREPTVHVASDNGINDRRVDGVELTLQISDSRPDHGVFVRCLQFHCILAR
jgi:hypothetical protein